jgi:hypothetical protein
MLKCENCGFESSYLDEVCYYDINGYPYSDSLDIERNAQNPDALAHKLCEECAKEFDFSL